mgnify:CR=1 FL=1
MCSSDLRKGNRCVDIVQMRRRDADAALEQRLAGRRGERVARRVRYDGEHAEGRLVALEPPGELRQEGAELGGLEQAPQLVVAALIIPEVGWDPVVTEGVQASLEFEKAIASAQRGVRPKSGGLDVQPGPLVVDAKREPQALNETVKVKRTLVAMKPVKGPAFQVRHELPHLRLRRHLPLLARPEEGSEESLQIGRAHV